MGKGKSKRKRNRKLTPEQKRARRKRKRETMIVFINGKQKRVPRYSEPMVEGLPVDEFIRRNADEIWYTQEEDYVALAELQRRCDRFHHQMLGDALIPQSESFDDDDWLLEDECCETFYNRWLVRCNDERFCPETDRPPPPDFPEEYDPVGFCNDGGFGSSDDDSPSPDCRYEDFGRSPF